MEYAHGTRGQPASGGSGLGFFGGARRCTERAANLYAERGGECRWFFGFLVYLFSCNLPARLAVFYKYGAIFRDRPQHVLGCFRGSAAPPRVLGVWVGAGFLFASTPIGAATLAGAAFLYARRHRWGRPTTWFRVFSRVGSPSPGRAGAGGSGGAVCRYGGKILHLA